MATSTLRQPIRVAVEGCGHGTLNSIYASVRKTCAARGWNGVDLLIIGGDFQAVRNAYDLNCASIPEKYRQIGDFHEYYSGARVAPYLTIFVGGNHEASNYLQELYYGGWVAPNIYYMGAANVVKLGPLRIAALSGIWKGPDYRKPHFERLPYNSSDVKSIYHVREIDTRKLLQIKTQVDIGISHDWPRGVEWHGEWYTLFGVKRHLEADARSGSLGSIAAKYVLDRLRPAYWFSAHLHVKYAAVIQHDAQTEKSVVEMADAPNPQKNADEVDLKLDDDDVAKGAEAKSANDDEIKLDLGDQEVPPEPPEANGQSSALVAGVPDDLRAQLPASFNRSPPSPNDQVGPSSARPQPPPPGITNATTRFLALDKCLPNRDFLQLTEIEPLTHLAADEDSNAPLQLQYDREWLAITRVFARDLQVGDPLTQVPPDKGTEFYRPLIAAEEAWVDDHIMKAGKAAVPNNFVRTAPVYDARRGISVGPRMPREYSNPQTQQFCQMLHIPNPFHADEGEIDARIRTGPRPEPSNFGREHGRGGRGGCSGGRFSRGNFSGRGRGRGRPQ
ncbi:lariat debranching enzyme, C-terminal domain-containing protein [Lineolata rhizophorae]|uniref:Lariat debranching enzyme, C-terminal domain-containing protein n=1 Tax=Lineolata rhizophorae TaxID=578093 RepID=A0A6A6PB93_9PEZI|nr:lariat debranching enzyme, C-terminal domain-containing protein [Lineolata rhizophorae]